MARSNRSRRRRGSVSSARPRSYTEYRRRRPDITEAETEVQAGTETELRTSDAVDWSREYGNVFSDLRQLLVVSAVLFAAMIALGFFI